MKLLSKNEIQKAKNADKSKEIAEGLKISRRVDSLRELMAKEEESLAKFRSESLAAIMKDIDKLDEEKNALVAEVAELRKERVAGLTDIEKEKNEIEFFKKILDKREDTIRQKSEEIKEKEAQISALLTTSKDEAMRASTHTEEARKAHFEAEKNRTATQTAYMIAQETKEQAFKLKIDGEMQLSERNARLNEKEEELKKQQILIKEKEEELNIQRKQLADQRATLERAMQRLKQ